MIPNVREAKMVQDKISAVIHDVKLFYDHATERWAICQLNENAGGLILPSREGMTQMRPTIMFRCQTANGQYRSPIEQDVADLLALRHNAEIAFRKGGDWVADQMEAREKQKMVDLDTRQTVRIADVAKDLKKAIKTELA
jgi:hypothetical protein